jgi:hypothetical protein
MIRYISFNLTAYFHAAVNSAAVLGCEGTILMALTVPSKLLLTGLLKRYF